MADTTKTAAPAKTADVKDEVTLPTNQEITQTIRLIRFKLSGLQQDARRARPFMSPSQDEAAAKVKAAVAALEDFANYLDKQPTH
ncbi:hypothetical protein M3672_15010 [Microbacterium enclense]|uniref:hypothetical protein n=1 Tax=Microbacterium enclense TaxID=993073 RepID=UPI00203ED4D9|nr:hypothetical protein [Microbacterium enclense]MCM3615740.1 hypothetical protein [Microbacterium enclense]